MTGQRSRGAAVAMAGAMAMAAQSATMQSGFVVPRAATSTPAETVTGQVSMMPEAPDQAFTSAAAPLAFGAAVSLLASSTRKARGAKRSSMAALKHPEEGKKNEPLNELVRLASEILAAGKANAESTSADLVSHMQRFVAAEV
eukprot:CAMPEP_0197666078 /NCGR_PEP_ID=MMETSP1338-20131121/61460_1 /TAXON_ID=43686 ORGANISM="Pelagodinium beii, Strain RCC1491" /NCGR_SAMPLE_ID=MMETSP1338 /ASSEMBLY_ACC=CAM_ASM_000754 /LENGTH=142 /DNA_ID=CAMNT_0043245049 /DNA_START=32 /DNA_END=456 /DNA_ORIENTATION=-